MDFRFIKQKHRTMANCTIWAFILGALFGLLEYYFSFDIQGIHLFILLSIGFVYMIGVPCMLCSLMENDFYKNKR